LAYAVVEFLELLAGFGQVDLGVLIAPEEPFAPSHLTQRLSHAFGTAGSVVAISPGGGHKHRGSEPALVFQFGCDAGRLVRVLG
jgi:hypothetical protein